MLTLSAPNITFFRYFSLKLSGTALFRNLTKNGYSISAAYDVKKTRAELSPHVKCCSSPREVAENSDILISGIF